MGNSHQLNVQGDVSHVSRNNYLGQHWGCRWPGNDLRDLDQASMEAVAALLAGLPLQPEESDRGDLMEAKSQLFLK